MTDTGRKDRERRHAAERRALIGEEVSGVLAQSEGADHERCLLMELRIERLPGQQGGEAAQDTTAQYRCYPVATIGDILAGTR